MDKRIGLFGGTFNPVHIGHLLMAQDAAERYGLDRVIFIPAEIPPHKIAPLQVSSAHRLEMLRLATSDDARFAVSDLEIQRGGVSYTIDTVRVMMREHPDAHLYFIIGGDTLKELRSWKDIQELLTLVEFITLARPSTPAEHLKPESLGLPAPWPEKLLRNMSVGHLVELSSTDIRHRISAGLSIRYLVPEAVAAYIRDHNLYTHQEIRP